MSLLSMSIVACAGVVVGSSTAVCASIYLTKRAVKKELQRRNTLLELATHELRTPLHSVLGLISTLKSKRPSNDPQLARPLDDLDKSGHDLHSVLVNLVDLFELTKGRIEKEAQLVNVSEIANQCIELVDHRDSNVINITKNDYWAVVDPVRLRQSLMSLLRQAIFQAGTGNVQIVVRAVGNGHKKKNLQILIKDDGSGIQPRLAHDFFDATKYNNNPFLRGRPRAVLDLYLARKIVTLLGGGITVKSNLNKGCLFVFKVPARLKSVRRKSVENQTLTSDSQKSHSAKLPAIKTREQSTSLTTSLLSGMRVMLVDDVAINLQVLEAFVSSFDPGEVILSNDGAEAVKFANETHIDLIFMDIQMPEMDGFKTTELIREIDGYEKVPIIPVSAISRIVNEDVCKQATMTGFIQKPINKAILEETIRAAIGNATRSIGKKVA